MKYDIVVFDLDGTLINTIQDLGEAVNYALGLRGLPLHATEEYYPMVGHGVRNLVINALPLEYRSDDAYIDAIHADFKVFYQAHIDVHTHPYPGIPEMLEKLQKQGAALAVASNKFQAGTEKLIKEFFPGIDWLAILGNRPGAPLKPDPEIVKEVLDKFRSRTGYHGRRKVSEDTATGCLPGGGTAIMVGDSATDIHTAHNGGIRAIAVSWGFRPVSDLSEADFIAFSPKELEDLLLQ